jgi:hypothetical protein
MCPAPDLPTAAAPARLSAGREWSIYALVDPRTNAVRYIGWTVNVRRRLCGHLRRARTEHGAHRAGWLRQLMRLGLRPNVQIVERGVGVGWQAAEKKWIANFLATGARLTNKTFGGDGTLGFRPSFSAEHRRRISESKRGGKRPDAVFTAKRMAEGNRGKKMKLSAAERARRRVSLLRIRARGHWMQHASPERLATFAARQAESVTKIWARRTAHQRAQISRKMANVRWQR